jgi:hypothetical protein
MKKNDELPDGRRLLVFLILQSVSATSTELITQRSLVQIQPPQPSQG